MTRREKLCKGNLSMSLLDGSNLSDAARSSSIDSGNSDCENRTGGEHQKEVLKLKFGLNMLENDMPVLGLAGRHQEIQSRHLKAGTQS
jgi:hypothetical protein